MIATLASPFSLVGLAQASLGLEVAPRPRSTFALSYGGHPQPLSLALADNAGALQAKHSINRDAAKRGLGKTPAVIETHVHEKFAMVHASAVAATFDVPFGWHVVDNGKRTLVFDADHEIEVHLDVRQAADGARAFLKGVLADQRKRQPSVKAQLSENADGSGFLVMQNYEEKGESNLRAYATHAAKNDGELIVAQVSAKPSDLIRALNLTTFILRHLETV